MGVCGLGLSVHARPLKGTGFPPLNRRMEEGESRVPQLRIQTSALYQKRRSQSGVGTTFKAKLPSRKTSAAETRQRASSFCGGKDFL